MANAIKWDAAATSRGNIATTELNSLADNGYVASAEYDNSANLDQFGALEIRLASLNPTTGAFLSFFIIAALDGTTYPDTPSGTNVSAQLICAQASVATGSATKNVRTSKFEIPPCKFKVVTRSDLNVSFASSGNEIELFTWNNEVQ